MSSSVADAGTRSHVRSVVMEDSKVELGPELDQPSPQDLCHVLPAWPYAKFMLRTLLALSRL